MTVMMINVDDDEHLAYIKIWAAQFGLSFPLLNDIYDLVFFQYSPPPNYYIPHNTLIDTSMKVIYSAVGYDQQAILNRINNYYQPVIANQLTLSHGYIRMGVDTLTLNAPVTNPDNHNVELYAMFESIDSVYHDSLMLYDDGNHHDVAANDGIYGNTKLAPMVEQEIMVGLKMLDLDCSVKINRNDLDRFTTAGPVAIYSCNEVNRAGNTIYFQLKLVNIGSTTSVGNVQAKIRVTDPYATGVINDSTNFGYIGAGQTATSSGNFGVTTANLPNNHTFVFQVEIFSNNSSYWEDSTSVVVVLSELDNIDPKVFALKQNYPNPFNPSTKIKYTLPKSEKVKIEIFNLLGQKIKTLIYKKMPAGNHEIEFTAKNLPSGVYLYRIQSGEFQEVKKMVLLK
jgi:type IX secretion system substrate protein